MADDTTPSEVELKAVDNNTQRQLNFSAAATVAFAFAFLMLAMTLTAPVAETNDIGPDFSVEWWNTLHQPATIKLTGESSMDPSMLPPLIWMVISTKLFFGAALLDRARNELLDQDRSKSWVARKVLQADQ